jgi:uncharacterized membrane protein
MESHLRAGSVAVVVGVAGLLYLGGGHPSLGKDITIDTALDPADLKPGETASKLAAKMGMAVSADGATSSFKTSLVPAQYDVPEGSIILPLRVVPPTVSTPYEHIQIAFKPPKADDPILYTIDPPAGQHGDVVLEAMSTYALAVAGWENYTNIGEAFVWTPQDGITLIGPGKAFGINADGTVVVGTDPDIKGFRWTEATGMVPIGGIFSGGHSEAFAVSNDGSAIAGDAQVADQSSTYHAIRWDLTNAQAGTGTITDLGTIATDDPFRTTSKAHDISGDGRVVVGESGISVSSPVIHAFESILGDATMHDLGVVSGLTNSTALAVSYDGAVIVGASSTPTAHNFVDPGNLLIPATSVATRWTAATGPEDLNQLLATAQVSTNGYLLLTANSISPDGQFIGGEAVLTGSPDNTPATAYIVRYCDATVSAVCALYDSLFESGSGGGITTPAEQQASVNGLADDRLKLMAGEHGFAAPLLGDNAPINGTNGGGVYASGGSLAGGLNGRYDARGITFLGGIANASEGYGGVDMSGGLLVAGAARYQRPWSKDVALLAEAGGWVSPAGSYRFTRQYGAGTGIGETTGSQSYLFGRAGAVWARDPADELVFTGEIGRQQLDTAAYAEALSGNPFNATVSAGSDAMVVGKARVQWTHSFSPKLDTTLWAAIAGGAGRTSTVTTSIAGVGPVTPSLGNPVWGEFGARVGYHVSDRVQLEGFANGVLAGGLGSSIHFGGGLKVSF